MSYPEDCSHLPRTLREAPRYQLPLGKRPPKHQAAILASEFASSLVYQQDHEADYELILIGQLNRYL